MYYQVYYHQNGRKKRVLGPKAQEIEQILAACLPQTNNRMLLYVDKSIMQKIFSQEAAWEIAYERVQECTFSHYGLEMYSKIIVPTQGDLSANPNSGNLTFIVEYPNGSWSVWGCPFGFWHNLLNN